MDRKRARLDATARLLHTGQISSSGLRLILQKLKSSSESAFASRNLLTAANEAVFTSVRVVECLTLDTGEDWQWEFADPGLLLSRLVEERPELQAVYAHAVEQTPPSLLAPWHLAVGFDEFVPGNKLNVDNRRKTMVVSFTFLELGAHAITTGDVWVIPVCIRASILNSVVGGWSMVLRQFLLRILTGPTGLCTAGVPLNINGRTVMLYARLTNILSDGEGHKKAFDWRGFAGLKPCFKHWNVWKKGSELAGLREGHVEITCSDHTKFLTSSQDGFNDSVDLVLMAGHRAAAGTMTKIRFEEIQQACGLNFNPHGMIADIRLRQWFNPLAVLTYDWVHSMLQDGVFNAEIQAMLAHGGATGITRESIREWLSDPSWVFPAATRSKCKRLFRVFDDARVSDSNPEKLKGNCQEMLGIYGLVRHLVELRVASDDPIARSFGAVCTVIDAVLRVKRGIDAPAVAVPALRTALSRHLELHKAAYGDQYIRPKHHWMLDVPDQVIKDGMVLDAFVLERHHSLVKAVADHIDNTVNFERKVLE